MLIQLCVQLCACVHMHEASLVNMRAWVYIATWVCMRYMLYLGVCVHVCLHLFLQMYAWVLLACMYIGEYDSMFSQVFIGTWMCTSMIMGSTSMYVNEHKCVCSIFTPLHWCMFLCVCVCVCVCVCTPSDYEAN